MISMRDQTGRQQRNTEALEVCGSGKENERRKQYVELFFDGEAPEVAERPYPTMLFDVDV